MIGNNDVLSRKQKKEICTLFKCRKNEFAVRKYDDGFLVSVRNEEYKVKFSQGFNLKIVYCEKVKRKKR